MGGVAEYAVRQDGSLAEVTVRRGGHDADADVTELAAAAAGPGGAGPAAGLIASAGTDGRSLLWDFRQPAKPALHAPRCRRDVNAVALAPEGGGGGGGGGGDGAAGPLLACAGDDGVVRVYDVRQLCSGGGGGSATASTSAAAAGPAPALHRLKGHGCRVLQLAFSPHHSRLLASADALGRVLLWELGRTTPLPEGLASQPELLFVHAGHVLPVDDVSWSTELYGALASTAGFLDVEQVEGLTAAAAEGGLEVQGPVVQVWQPAADLLPKVAAAAN
ncbi:Histone acetyltransferase type B subunit 2 [Tetrabaena socialis]|uniref:Histone acetyltransferase type B subunit 2 n=1 Tax=Tetrabaena socialis TaxID=47790 RepID=A0A2J7ZVD3_9CHLO|nr:Histone acetyltransferase type B subunit 2 [Tetrabaena socialis]|eukprot:PNH04224.1 Histone acetyltransferase type B subunit 2 [Tetrabaena socialis]